MRRRPRKIPQRRPIFLGCEGESERGYAALLAQPARDLPHVHVHINAQVLQPGAGDPAALIQRAAKLIAEIERRRTMFTIKAVLLDLGLPGKNAEARASASDAGIDFVIWQDPDHEAMLLRHLPNCQHRRPPTGATLAMLQREWPGYSKGMSAKQLSERISLDQVRRACSVEPDLRAFLAAVGLFDV